MYSNLFIQQPQGQQPQQQQQSLSRGRTRQFPQASYFNTQPQPQPQPQPQQQQQQQQQFQQAPAPAPMPMATTTPLSQMPLQQQQQQQPSPVHNEPPKPKRKIDPSQMPNPATILSGPQVSQVEKYVTKPEPLPSAEPLPMQGGFGFFGLGEQQQQQQQSQQQQPHSQENDSLPLPPPVNKPNVQVVDNGNCNPKFMRLSMYSWPQSRDMLGTVNLPLGAVITPLADVDQSNPDECVYLVDSAENGGGGAPVRCKRCGAYISPLAKFDATGRTYKCAICDAENNVPDWYYSPMDPSGKRADIESRPELMRGTVEFAVTNDMYYTNKKAPRPAGLCFVIDVSERALANGSLGLVTATLKQFIETGLLEGVSVGVITYNAIAHFWDLSGAKPRMLAVPDYDEPFAPMYRGAFVTASSSSSSMTSSLITLLDSIADVAGKQSPRERTGESGLGAALKAARAMFSGQEGLGGRVLLFHSSLPVAAPASAVLRDNYTLYGTDKEKTLYQPQAPFYGEFGRQLAAARVGLDAFLFSKEYIDVASVGALCKATGGQVYFYHHFEAARDAWRFDADVRRDVTRAWGYDASLRVRVSRGVSVLGYTGHFTPANYADDIDIAVIDADKTIGVTFAYDDSSIKEGSHVAVQCALLYTTSAGERRVRVHNISVPVSGRYAAVFKALDCDALVSLFARDAVDAACTRGQQLPTIVGNAFDRVAEALAAYRRLCTKNPASGQLILPESVRLLPLYMNALSKSPILRREVRPDMRCIAFHQALSEPPATLALRLYPRAFDVADVLGAQPQDFPLATRLGSEFVAQNSVYIVDDGAAVYVWLGKNPSAEAFERVFPAGSVAQDASSAELTQAFSASLAAAAAAAAAAASQETQEASPIAKLIQFFATQRMHNCFSINVIREADVSNYSFLWAFLIEDAQAGNLSYVDYLCTLHKKIQQKIIDVENQNASIMAMAFSHI